MQIKLKKISIQNFKGIKDVTFEFGDITNVFGKNATGKTTIADAFTFLLFDKDSAGASKFIIRPLDVSGNQIDNVEIIVEATLDVDGKKVILKKVQKQNWVKKRGADIAELQGNVNFFEINGYPKSEKDYKECVSSFVEEELFKLITNPESFAALPWKKQRETLMKLVGEISDIEIAQSDATFVELLPELEQASTDDIQKKYSKVLSEWKKKQIELPARIDEASKGLIYIDLAELNLHKNDLIRQIDDVENQSVDSESAIKEYDKISDEILFVKNKMKEIYDKESECISIEKKRIHNQIDDAVNEFKNMRSQIKSAELKIEQFNKSVEQNENEKLSLQNEWKTKKIKTFIEFEELPLLDENSLVCPTCGQELTEELKNQKITDYEQRKKQHRIDYDNSKNIFINKQKEQLADIEKQGAEIVKKINEYNVEIERLNLQIKKLKENSVYFIGAQNDAIKELEKLPKTEDLSENDEYKTLQLQLSNLEQSLQSMETGSSYRSKLKTKLSGLREELIIVEKNIANADNTAVEERIEKLQLEQKEIGQKVADQEKMIYLLEEFIRAKMNRISDCINAKFKTVKFLLFRNQINGGMAECCEITKDGVPYSALNSAGKIQAGIDFINTLQEIHRVKCPIFIDNRESVTEIPNIDCQIVSLYVSPQDIALRVEIEQ